MEEYPLGEFAIQDSGDCFSDVSGAGRISTIIMRRNDSSQKAYYSTTTNENVLYIDILPFICLDSASC